jgi:hypothetical protein
MPRSLLGTPRSFIGNRLAIADMTSFASSRLLCAMRMSSVERPRIIIELSHRVTCRQGSDSNRLNPMSRTRNLLIVEFHIIPASLRPYMLRFRRQTNFGSVTWKPGGCRIYISSFSSDCRKTPTTSNWWSTRSFITANANIVRIEESRATDAKVSSQSILGHWEKPRTTNLELNLSIEPSF